MLQGRFVITDKHGNPLHKLKNFITLAGAQSFLKMAARGDDTDVAFEGDFYIGMCSGAPTRSTALSGITGEPTATNGYAREAVERSSVGFPTLDVVADKARMTSLLLSFTATGGDFSAAFTRLFLCNVASGTSGILYAVSAALETEKLVVEDETLSAYYELYF